MMIKSKLAGPEIDHVLKVLNSSAKNTFNVNNNKGITNNLIITNDNSFFDVNTSNTSMNSDNNSDMDTTLVTDS